MVLRPLGRMRAYDPFNEMRRLQADMNRLMEDYEAPSAREHPRMNVWSGPAGVLVTAPVPGVHKGDLEITVDDETLTVKGKRESTGDAGLTYHRRERATGTFARTIELPFRVDTDKVEASLHDGVLTIKLPRPASEQPKRINISIG